MLDFRIKPGQLKNITAWEQDAISEVGNSKAKWNDLPLILVFTLILKRCWLPTPSTAHKLLSISSAVGCSLECKPMFLDCDKVIRWHCSLDYDRDWEKMSRREISPPCLPPPLNEGWRTMVRRLFPRSLFGVFFLPFLDTIRCIF